MASSGLLVVLPLLGLEALLGGETAQLLRVPAGKAHAAGFGEAAPALLGGGGPDLRGGYPLLDGLLDGGRRLGHDDLRGG
ncbi:hypothetical protein [Streptomyces sp. 1222.5]|uniref:hypothetical protein n=1 Tax=Streptomyces sp. 1222.5 TaxID=1881026 RepID=UPI003D72EAE6